jgi:hypothetical protein
VQHSAEGYSLAQNGTLWLSEYSIAQKGKPYSLLARIFAKKMANISPKPIFLIFGVLFKSPTYTSLDNFKSLAP